jgi:hypothetical protein
MTVHPIYIHNHWIFIQAYRHSSLLYVISKMVKAINADLDIPAFAYIGNDDESIAWKPFPTTQEITIDIAWSNADEKHK